MAIRQKPSGSWEVYYRHPVTGRRKSETYSTQKEAVQKDALIKYRIKFERESFEVEDVQQTAAMTFEEVLWLFFQSKNYDRESLRLQIKEFRPWLSTFKTKTFTEVTKGQLLAFKNAMLSRGCKATTIRRRFKAIKALLRWGIKEGYLNEMPTLPELPLDDTKHFVPPTKDEVMLMMKYAPPHIQRVIIMGFCFGARIGPCELFRLEWKDVDLSRKVLRMPSSRKNIHEPWRELPIRDELVPVFGFWRDEDSHRKKVPLTVIHFNGKPVRSVYNAWCKTLEKAGLRHIRPYDLRHAFATEAMAAGVDVGTTAKMMGHTSPMMVLKTYQYVTDRQKQAAMEIMPCVSDSVCPKRISSEKLM